MFNRNKYAIFQHRSIQFDLYVFFVFQFSKFACVLTAMVKCIYASFPDRPFLTFPKFATERFEERDLEGVRESPKRRCPAKQRLWYPRITCSYTMLHTTSRSKVMVFLDVFFFQVVFYFLPCKSPLNPSFGGIFLSFFQTSLSNSKFCTGNLVLFDID